MTARVRTVWCVSDGRSGIARQTVAIASALSELTEIKSRNIHVNPAGLQTWLLPQLWPMPMTALHQDQRDQLKSPWPDIWIANGRRSIPYSLQAKKWSGGKSFIVQLQNPRVDPAFFDLVVPPRHDGVVGSNVIETLGAPVWFTNAQIAAATAQFPKAATLNRRTILVILGGPSKRHKFSLSRAHAIIGDLTRISASGIVLQITTSRRTPAVVVALFRSFAQSINASFFADEVQDGPNPYLAWLAQADATMVTEDSTNMMTDAAFFGLPIHLIKLEGGDPRFDRLHQGFIAAGAARWFDGSLETWTYQPIRDALNVAKAIIAKLAPL